jgi:hypothetical protein
MQRRTWLALLGLIILSLILFVTLAQSQPPTARMGTNAPGIAFSGANLLVAIPLADFGTADALNVMVTKITLGTQALNSPSLPLTVGNIAAGADSVLQLSFSNAGLSPGGHALLTLQGTYSSGAATVGFQVNRVLTLPPPDTGNPNSGQVDIPPVTVSGGNFPPSNVGFQPESANEDDGFPLPPGPLIGSLQPDGDPSSPGSPNSNFNLIARAPQLNAVNAPITFVRVGTKFVQNNPGGFGPWDPSGASVDVASDTGLASRLVFLTGNTYALLSTDGGSTFTKLDPTTIFPNFDSNNNLIDGGLCCDQVIQYIPSINRVVWLMQFWRKPLGGGVLGPNRIRIASASPSQIIGSGGTSWTYWDLTSATFGLGNNWMDYPDMAFTNNFLHISIDEVGTGSFVIRGALSEIATSSTLHLRYTHPTDGGSSYGSHLTQDSPDSAYWFGQLTTSSLRVFEWLDSSTSYSWRTVNVNSWLNTSYATTTPGGTDWLNFGFGRWAIRGATLRSDINQGQIAQRTIKIAWSAARGGGFPQPYVRLVDIVKSTVLGITSWGSANESQIWNASVAFQFPYMTTNSNGEVGISLAFGGPNNHASPVAGFVGDSTLFFTNLSSMSLGRWGDYSAIRKHWANPKLFSVSEYFLNGPNADRPTGQVIHQYRMFGRSADVGGTF